MLVLKDIPITSGSLRFLRLIGIRGVLRFWSLGGGRNLDCLFPAHRPVLYCCISLTWSSIAGLIVNDGRLDRPITGGPPSGTRDLHFLTLWLALLLPLLQVSVGLPGPFSGPCLAPLGVVLPFSHAPPSTNSIFGHP